MMADHLGVSRHAMSKLLNGHQGLSADMAIRFEKAVGLKANTLLAMQSAYKLAEAREREDEIAVERVALDLVHCHHNSVRIIPGAIEASESFRGPIWLTGFLRPTSLPVINGAIY
jgi:addiction module HigA family antidote